MAEAGDGASQRTLARGARQLRALVPVEIGAIVVAALVPLPIPVVIPLLAVASLSLWVRRRSWAGVVQGPPVAAAIGLGAGLVALALAVAVGTPVIERITDQAVQWSMYPIVRGSPTAAVMVAILVAIGAVAAELVLRGWILERTLELGARPVVAILVAALAEALLVFPLGASDSGPFVIGGDVTARIGAGMFGLALGWMYLAGGRSVVAPICARIAFALGALALEATRIVG